MTNESKVRSNYVCVCVSVIEFCEHSKDIITLTLPKLFLFVLFVRDTQLGLK